MPVIEKLDALTLLDHQQSSLHQITSFKLKRVSN